MRPTVKSSSSKSESPAPRRTGRFLYALIAVLSFAGIVDSGIALQRHYAKTSTQFCDFSQRFSCDVVNRSEYSSVVGIPVAGIGVAGYGFLLLLATLWKMRGDTPTRLLAASLVGLAFALYLTYIEAYKLETWCILCIFSLALITFISILAIILKTKADNAA